MIKFSSLFQDVSHLFNSEWCCDQSCDSVTPSFQDGCFAR